MIQIGTVERAFELARSGECRTVTELITRMRREGRSDADLHLSGAAIRKQLVQIIRQHRD